MQMLIDDVCIKAGFIMQNDKVVTEGTPLQVCFAGNGTVCTPLRASARLQAIPRCKSYLTCGTISQLLITLIDKQLPYTDSSWEDRFKESFLRVKVMNFFVKRVLL